MRIQTLKNRHVRSVLLVVAVVLCQTELLVAPAQAQPSADMVTGSEKRTLQFAFERAPWRSVLSWVADEAGLALYISELPTGTFTYSDPNLFTPSETIDRINLFLIPQGYTFVRSGKLLSLISLGDPRSMKQLDAMASFVTIDKLEQRGTYDVVKCIFPLGNAEPAVALSELSGLDLIMEPIVLPGSNQLLITDTAGKLKTVKAILDSLEAPERSSEIVTSFVLQHAEAENVLTAARAHLGIEPGEMSGFDVNLSTDAEGRKIFVTGSKQSIDVLESVINKIDNPGESIETRDNAVLRSHLVAGNNLRSVYDVLQTLLADQSIRLSEDEATDSIVALAPPAVHEQIKSTIAELEGPSEEFAVIDLKTLNPYSTIALLNELFGITDDELDNRDRDRWDRDRRRWDRNRWDDDESDASDTPKIHADPQTNRLFARGKPSQIEQIRRVVESLQSRPESIGNFRVLPTYGAQSQEILDTAKRLWRDENPILLLPPATDKPDEGSERTVHPKQPSKTELDREIPTTDSSPSSAEVSQNKPLLPRNKRPKSGTLLLSWADSFAEGADRRDRFPPRTRARQAFPISVRLTPRGIVIQSDDSDALDRFEDHLRLVAGLGERAAEPVVFYLKYATADEATRMLGDLLDGARWSGSPSNRSFVNGGVSSSTAGSYWGSLVLSREGTTTMTAGSATVISDARLNRLIVQGTAQDVSLIETFLKVIDKDSSITTVETRGKSHVIELRHSRASEVAAMIREAYSDRIAGDRGEQNRKRTGDDRNSERRGDDSEDSRDRAEEERRPAPKPTRNSEPAMTVAVHEASNSLIVTAPDPLFEEVKQLVHLVDQRAEQAVEVVVPRSVNARYVDSLLRNVLPEIGDRERRVRPAERSEGDERRESSEDQRRRERD